jgi:hypothetical protein
VQLIAPATDAFREERFSGFHSRLARPSASYISQTLNNEKCAVASKQQRDFVFFVFRPSFSLCRALSTASAHITKLNHQIHSGYALQTFHFMNYAFAAPCRAIEGRKAPRQRPEKLLIWARDVSRQAM